MDLEHVLNELSRYQRNAQLVVKLLKEIFRLDKNRMENLPRLRTRMVKLEELLMNLDENQSYILSLERWVNEYKSILEDTINQIQRKLGIELEEQLRKI